MPRPLFIAAPSCVPKVILEEHFQKRQARERRTIGACAWVDIAKSRVAGCGWRGGDEMLLKRSRQEAQDSRRNSKLQLRARACRA